MRLETGPREIIGYHGCTRCVAERLSAGDSWLPSQNRYDWLGEGIYFREYAPYRALEWAEERFGSESAVVRARIQLGRCVNLLDRRHFSAIQEIFAETKAAWVEKGIPILGNSRMGAHFLDCHILDEYCQRVGDLDNGSFVQSVRGCFPEGDPLYPGSKILTKAHIQVGVRDPSCILQIRTVQFLENLERRA